MFSADFVSGFAVYCLIRYLNVAMVAACNKKFMHYQKLLFRENILVFCFPMKLLMIWFSTTATLYPKDIIHIDRTKDVKLISINSI